MSSRVKQRAGPEDAISEAALVAREVAGPQADRVDREASWPRESLASLRDAGLAGLVVPVHMGGRGHGLLEVVRCCEVLGEHCASSALCFGMHLVGSAVIAAKPTPDQVAEYLGPICAGDHLTTLALSEPGTGAHFYLPETELVSASADTYRVSGTKTFVTNGGHADSYVISTVAATEEAPPGQFSCLVLRADTDGLEWGEPWQGVGMRGNSSRSLELRDVAVPRSDLLGAEGDQIWYIFTVVAPYFLMAMAGTYLGVSQAALDEATGHLRRRAYSMSGRRLAAEPLLQHRLGGLWAQVERARRLVYHAAEAADSGKDDALVAVLSAKAEVADCAVATTNEAMTLTGGIGYREHSRLHRLLRDARAAHVMSPTTDLLRTWAGRALLDEPLLSD